MDTRIAPLQPVVTGPEQVPAIKPFNIDMKVLLTSEDTADAMSVIVAWHNPGEGPPDHVHFNQEEIFFIVDGLYELTIDARPRSAAPVRWSSYRATPFIVSKMEARHQHACSTGRCRAGRTGTSKKSRNWPPAVASLATSSRSSTKSTTQPLFRTLTGSQILTPNQHVVAIARTYEIANRPSGYRRWRGKAPE